MSRAARSESAPYLPVQDICAVGGVAHPQLRPLPRPAPPLIDEREREQTRSPFGGGEYLLAQAEECGAGIDCHRHGVTAVARHRRVGHSRPGAGREVAGLLQNKARIGRRPGDVRERVSAGDA